MSYANIDQTFTLAFENLKAAFHNAKKLETRLWDKNITVDLANGSFQPEIDTVSKILVCHYLGSKSSMPWDGQWLSFKELPDGEIYNIPFQKRTIFPLLKLINDEPSKLIKLKEKLNGEEGTFGDISIILNPFPELYLAYIYWQGDEEFPANANILFSSNFPYYLPTEDCVVLASSAIWQLKGI